MHYKTQLFISDGHLPYQLNPAWKVTQKIIKYEQPDLLYFGGDMADPQSLSRHPKKPTEALKLNWEIQQIRREIREVRKLAPNAAWRWRIGNHEGWIQRHLNEKAGELADLPELKLESLLRFDESGIELIPDGTKERIGKLWHLHGHEIWLAGKSPARAMLGKLHANAIAGHVHKFDTASERDYKGDLHTCWTNGCLVPLTADWAHHTDWHLGFTKIQYTSEGYFNVTQIPIHEKGGVYFASYDGKTFEAVAEKGEVFEMPVVRGVTKADRQADKVAPVLMKSGKPRAMKKAA